MVYQLMNRSLNGFDLYTSPFMPDMEQGWYFKHVITHHNSGSIHKSRSVYIINSGSISLNMCNYS